MKTIKIVLISAFTIILLSQNLFAFNTTELFDTGENWEAVGKENAGIGIKTEALQKGAVSLYNILMVIAIAVVVIVGAIMGIKFMTAGIDKKVEIKESLIPYLISCIVIFGSFGIWKLVIMIMKSV